LPSARKSASWARRSCHLASSAAALGFPAHPGDRREAVPVGRVKGTVGCFAPTLGEPPGHRPFLLVFGAVTGEPALGPDPGDDLVHAGKASGGGAGFGSGGEVCGLESRILAAATRRV
jgi:hypothetical protein